MATCTKKEIPRPQFVYILKLTREEVETLREVCGKISGSSTSPRRHMDSICNALDAIGVGRIGYACGDINFSSNEP